MPDYQRTVEYLRDLRQGPLQTVTEEISHAAAEFAALCVSANERLRKCTSLLQQGLRTEALHLADESPNLLDLVAALDLPDPAAWADFCQNNGLPTPPPLQLDRASQLNDAYAQDQPLEHLLAQHRFLALARGPIGERLGILRKIASIDAGSTSWEKDIRVFEKARIKELPSLFYKAMRTKDESAIASLMNEVNQQPWFEPVPADLSTAVADAFNRMQRATVEIELRKLVEPLREAFAAQSVQECQALVQRWKNAMAAGGVTVISPELTDEIRPVIAYVAEQEKRAEYLRKFRDSCKAFGRMLDMDVPDAQLEVGYARLKEFNEPIPAELTERYQAKGAVRQSAIDRQHRTRLIGIGASAAGVAAVILVVFIFVQRAGDARQWGAKIDALVTGKNAENLQRAQQYVADLRKNHAGLLNEAPIARAIRDTDAKQSDFDRDAAAIQEFLNKFDAAAKNGSVVADNKAASLDQLLAAAGAINDTLAQANAAGDIAWADTPDKKFVTGTSHLQDILSTLRTRSATAVHAELDAAAAKVDAIGPAPANMSEASDQLGTIAARMRSLVALSGLDDDTRKAVATFNARVEKRRDALTAASTVAGELDNIRHNASTADDLKKSLTGYLQRFPNDARTQDFTASIDRLPLDKDIEAWRDLTSPWAGQFAPANAAAAQKRLDALAAYASAHPASPMSATAASYTEYLKRAADALIEKGTWQTAFADLFANPLLTDLAYMETSDGQRFYVLGDIKRTDRRINSQISITFEALNPTDPAKRMLVAVDPPATLANKDPIPVPHAKVVGELNDQLKTIDANNWDTWGIDTADHLVKNRQISIVVRAILLSQALRTENAVADWAIGDAYAQAITEFSRQKPENLSLLDPTRISAGTVKSLQTTIDAIPPAAPMKEKLATAKAALFKSVAFDVTGTAVLLKDDAGNWSVGGKTLATDGNLWTAIPAPAGAAPPTPAPAPTTEASSEPAPATPPATLVQIGTVTGGKFALYDNTLRDLPQGAMIFITQP